jgi:hypothetical protein
VKYHTDRVRCSLLVVTLLAVPAIAAPPPTGLTRVLPDDGGPIREITLHYDPEIRDALELAYDDLLDALDPDVDLQVFCPNHAAAQEFRHRWGICETARGRRVTVINARCPITIWARDRRIARFDTRTGAEAAPLIPATPVQIETEKRNEAALGAALATTDRRPGPMRDELVIEGGNVVANIRHVFVGANVFDDNADTGHDPDAIRRVLARELGNDLVLLRDFQGTVPWCHVDMYLTPLDERTVLLASPALGAAALDWDEIDNGNAPGIETMTDEIDDSPDIAKRFESIAFALEALGYRVRFAPALAGLDENWLVTYTNVLTERRGRRRIVYMPVYEIPSLDRLAARIYRRRGFEVRTVDVSGIFSLGGALRCIANVTRRDPLPSNAPRRLARIAPTPAGLNPLTAPDTAADTNVLVPAAAPLPGVTRQ